MKRNKLSYIVISDFDGTMIPYDVADKIIEYTYGKDIVEHLSGSLSNGNITITDFMNVVCYSLNMGKINPMEVVNIIIEKYKITVDKDVVTLKNLCCENNYPFYILSGGLKKIIAKISNIDSSHIISHDFDIVDNCAIFRCNQQIVPKGKIVEEHLLKYGRKIIFIGDGISDITVVKHCNIVFVKEKSVLENSCIEKNITYIPFNNFSDIIEQLKNLQIV